MLQRVCFAFKHRVHEFNRRLKQEALNEKLVMASDGAAAASRTGQNGEGPSNGSSHRSGERYI